MLYKISTEFTKIEHVLKPDSIETVYFNKKYNSNESSLIRQAQMYYTDNFWQIHKVAHSFTGSFNKNTDFAAMYLNYNAIEKSTWTNPQMYAEGMQM